MMVNAAENEGVQGQLVPGYYVAGKTGTASIPVAGGYDPTQTIASFVGVVPANDPQFVVLVKIDRPQDEPWGSLIAKPAFALIAQELTRYLKVPAEYRATTGLGAPTPTPTAAPRRPARATPTPGPPAGGAPAPQGQPAGAAGAAAGAQAAAPVTRVAAAARRSSPRCLALVAFGLGMAFGPRWLRFLKTREMGKQLNPSEPEEHAHKEGTPTMGGVVFFFPVVAVTLAFQVLAGGQTRLLLPLLVACALRHPGGGGRRPRR